MPSVRFKRVALDDLKAIVRTIAADNPPAARRFRKSISGKLELLAQNPRIAPRRPDIAPDIRYLPYGNYLIFYLPDAHGITVVRILHGARHLTPDLIAPVLRQ